MSQFVFFAALLTLIAVAFALSGLWQRSRALALALALGLPLAALGVYYLIGTPAGINPAVATAPATPATPPSIEDAVAQLQARLAREPDNFEGRVLLARSYMAMESFELARESYAMAMKLRPDDFDVSVEYAESLLRTSPDRSFPPEAVALLEQAVAASPDNQRALFFLGMHQFQSQQPAAAAATWEKLLPMLQPEAAVELRGQIDSARKAAGMEPLPAPEASVALVSVEISIDGVLSAQAREGDIIFVYARTLEGGGPPLAAKRVVLEKLPLVVGLSDADSPMPAAKLSSQAQVLVMARLSRSGNAAPASGDIEADPAVVDTKAGSSASLVLNRTVP